MKRAYDHFDWTPRAEAEGLIAQAEVFCEQYAAQGYELTLRQLYYQFVAADLVVNSDKSYNNLGNVISKARLAGMIDWDHITDRHRKGPVGRLDDTSIESAINRAAERHTLDLWNDQDLRVEVWVEKDALSQVAERAADRRQVEVFACKGYVSSSAMWEAAQRFRRDYMEHGQRVLILHLGDHDPSGLDMTRDIRERLNRFVVGDWAEDHKWGADAYLSGFGPYEIEDTLSSVGDTYLDEPYRERPNYDEYGLLDPDEKIFEVKRIALNMDQILRYNPPPNPAKLSDARAKAYMQKYNTTSSWELDALDPATLDTLITNEIDMVMDAARFNARINLQNEQRQVMRDAARIAIDSMNQQNGENDEQE